MIALRKTLIASLLATAATMATQPSLAQKNYELKATEQAHCTLTNVDSGRVIFSGRCLVTESLSDNRVRFTVQMRHTQPITFVRVAPGIYRIAHHAEEGEVRFADRGHIGVFRWDDLRLEVDEFG